MKIAVVWDIKQFASYWENIMLLLQNPRSEVYTTATMSNAIVNIIPTTISFIFIKRSCRQIR
jgi:hypothetical protein